MRAAATPRTTSVRGSINFASVMFGAAPPRNASRHALRPLAFASVLSTRARWALSNAMNSSKSGNVTSSLQAKAVEHALADELDAFVRRHVEPWLEVIIIVSIDDGDGPDAPSSILDEAHISGRSSAFHVMVSIAAGDRRSTDHV